MGSIVKAGVVVCVMLRCGPAADGQGLPARVAELERRVEELDRRMGPLTRVVDCAAGQSLAGALEAAERHLGPLTLRIRGICVERVTIRRDNLALQGIGPGAGLEAPAGAGGVVLALEGARDVSLSRLTVDGRGTARGLSVSGASAVSASDLVVRSAGFGIVVSAGSAAWLTRAVIEENALNGVTADGYLQLLDSQVRANGGTGLWVSGRADVASTTFEDNQAGIKVYDAGRLQLSEGAIRDNTRAGLSAELGSTAEVGDTVISGNGGDGVQATVGSSLELGSLTIEGNARGLYVTGGSSVRLATRPDHPLTVEANASDGIYVADASLVQAAPDVRVTANAGWGVLCEGAPAVALGRGFSATTVTGNASGQIRCPGIVVP